MLKLPGTGSALIAQAFELAVPPQLRSALRRALGRPLLQPWIDGEWFARRGKFEAVRGLKPGKHLLHDALAQSLTETVLPALLRFGDRNSMAFSIESRVPFLTPQLADLAYSLPSDQLIDGSGISKSALRAAMRGIVPDAILDRRDKVAFATPDKLWARALQPWFTRVLRSDTARSLPWLNSEAALRALDGRIARSEGFGFDLWRTVNLVRWIENFNVATG